MKGSSLQNRSVHYDLLRIFASLAVICIHVCSDSFTWEAGHYSTSVWGYLNVFDSLSRFAVPIFVMLSGCFMIDKYKENSLKKLYSKNISRLACAFVFWSCVYVAVGFLKNVVFNDPIYVKDLVYKLIEGEFHLWFIPMLVVLYAVTPLLKELCNSQKNEQYFVLLACIPVMFNFVKYFITIQPLIYLFDKAGFQFVSGYTIYYILGHYLNKYEVQKKHRILIYIFAVFSVVATVFVSYWHYDSKKNGEPFIFEFLSPTVLIVSVAVFLLFKYNISKIKFKERSQKFIIKLSSMTFGIYLSHMVFVRVFNRTPLTVENVHPLISVPLLTVTVFILGTITTWIISKIPILKKYII